MLDRRELTSERISKGLDCETGSPWHLWPAKAFRRNVKPETRRDPAALNAPEAYREYTAAETH